MLSLSQTNPSDELDLQVIAAEEGLEQIKAHIVQAEETVKVNKENWIRMHHV